MVLHLWLSVEKGRSSLAGVRKLFGLHAGVLGGLVGPNLVGGGRQENIGVDHIVCVGNSVVTRWT